MSANDRIALNTLTSIEVYLSPEQNRAVLAALKAIQNETAAVYAAKVKELEAELVKARTGRG
jgi:hypothetical protein